MKEYVIASQGAQVQNGILNQVEALSKASSASQQVLVRERMNALISEARRDMVHAEMREAAAQIYSSLGYDPYGADIRGDVDVATIAASLEALWKQRSKAWGLRYLLKGEFLPKGDMFYVCNYIKCLIGVYQSDLRIYAVTN